MASENRVEGVVGTFAPSVGLGTAGIAIGLAWDHSPGSLTVTFSNLYGVAGGTPRTIAFEGFIGRPGTSVVTFGTHGSIA